MGTQESGPAARETPDAVPALSVVVPCYNEQETVHELHRRLSGACREVVGDGYELVLVNDGSTDATGAIFVELVQDDHHTVGVELSRNYGHQVALTAGLSICRGWRILIIDADLQDPPELLAEMMRLMDEGADVVYGERSHRAGETRLKRWTATLFYRVLRGLTDIDIPINTGDFRLISRRALDALLAMPEQHRFVRGMVSWIGFRQVPVRYQRSERFAGETKYPLRKMLRLAGDAITGFSIRPLRIANYLSVLFALGALVVLAYAVWRWFADATVPGWTSVMTVVLILGSFHMIVLAIMCEYLGRLFIEAKRRPLFLIDRVVRQGRPGHGVAAAYGAMPLARPVDAPVGRIAPEVLVPARGDRPRH